MAGGNWTAAGLAIPITQVNAGCSSILVVLPGQFPKTSLSELGNVHGISPACTLLIFILRSLLGSWPAASISSKYSGVGTPEPGGHGAQASQGQARRGQNDRP